ncbi:dihydrodipicolinate synthase family protein [Cellulosimicrobium protaetiae]|uniref:Dihydrodipicolinate synthase family protein n=1 Tax=Cellulosimicrobium protaetiae TaxID=2587808 RepID=A0A6M5UG16_9MICO|nr:dihydrodipicolinate synthase family protein [Cellulosimicrobium protaetiae]QJW36241.1 dihydrodipicolinate synthase family protein [Cellulosimicrobium protaetiae]
MTSFHGLLAYPITPLTPDDAPDLDALAGVVGRAVRAGVDGVVVLASSGAGVTFTPDERDTVVRAAVGSASAVGATAGSPRVPVHVAVSGTSTRDVVAHARAARDGGADGLVLAPFSYLPLDEEEVVAVFEAVASAVDLPVCYYNRSVQTAYDVTPDALARLARTATVSAVKDPASTPARPTGRVATLRAATEGLGVSVGLSGDAAIVGGAEAADAWHTGLAALVPEEYVALRRARSAGTDPGTQVATWLRDLTAALASLRPVSGFHALANLIGVPTAPPRGPSLPVPPDGVARLREVMSRRPGRSNAG